MLIIERYVNKCVFKVDRKIGTNINAARTIYIFFFYLFIYPEESRYMMNGFRLSPAVGTGLAFP